MGTLERFYSAFAQRDWSTMGACYAEDAHFSDPVFPDLDAKGARAMWKMLLTSGTDLRLSYKLVEESATGGVCEWEAHYTFRSTGRRVRNIIRSEFRMRDGTIVDQRDHFSFWRWSRQALGVSGWLLGWSPMLRAKVRSMAAANLRKAMA